ncbi:TRAFAC clade GTPase domain-containing protein [Hymenobacter rubidus]|uniref:TRAFAC clade GTPase domain-containing protein n=1 Tax=Hymenobacter rubidus TaxID=1441626 RepID=UPI00191DA933|nr:hypothetical protein [Hymenobacter rubidus]
MASLQTPKIVLLGLPSTGKTSFLAALRHYIEVDTPNKKLIQYDYSENDEYLTKIYFDWLGCALPTRTPANAKTYRNIKLFLQHIETEEKLILDVPDIAGETFNQQWESRSWTKLYMSEIEQADGLILFIHSQDVRTPVFLHDIYALTEGEEEDYISKLEPWSPRKAPTQVVLVELLQFHLEHFHRKPMPVAIVISAWEKLLSGGTGITPERWLERNLPLLSQFLIANQEKLQTNVYGVSAQGGDFANTEERTKLQHLDDAAERIKVQVGTEHSNDISAPIQWLLNTWQSPSTQ